MRDRRGVFDIRRRFGGQIVRFPDALAAGRKYQRRKEDRNLL